MRINNGSERNQIQKKGGSMSELKTRIMKIEDLKKYVSVNNPLMYDSSGEGISIQDFHFIMRGESGTDEVAIKENDSCIMVYHYIDGKTYFMLLGILKNLNRKGKKGGN